MVQQSANFRFKVFLYTMDKLCLIGVLSLSSLDRFHRMNCRYTQTSYEFNRSIKQLFSINCKSHQSTLAFFFLLTELLFNIIQGYNILMMIPKSPFPFCAFTLRFTIPIEASVDYACFVPNTSVGA